MASGKSAASGLPRRTVFKYVEARREAKRSPWQGASLGEEAVLADSGRAGEIAARGWAGQKRAIFNILLLCSQAS
jgi:hypothetical protein